MRFSTKKRSKWLAEWLIRIRKRKSVSRDEFADVMGVSTEEVALYERCLSMPSPDFVEKASALFGYSIGEDGLPRANKKKKSPPTVAKTVKSLRKELGLSLEEFGKRIGYSGEMIRQIEEDQAIDTILFRESVEREYGVKL